MASAQVRPQNIPKPLPWRSGRGWVTLQVRDPILPPFFSPFQRKDPALGCAKITTASSRTGMSQGHRDVRGGTLGTRRGSGGLCSSGSGLSPAGTIPSPPSFPGFILGQTPAPYPLHKGGSGGIWGSGSFLRTPRPPSVARGSFPMEGGEWGGEVSWALDWGSALLR